MHLKKVNYSLMREVLRREHNTLCNPVHKIDASCGNQCAGCYSETAPIVSLITAGIVMMDTSS